MKTVNDEHVPGANVAWAAWTGNGVLRGPIDTGKMTLAPATTAAEHKRNLGFITDSSTEYQGQEQRFWRSGLRRIALQDVRVKINDKLNQRDNGTVAACHPGLDVRNNHQRATDLRHAADQGAFTPSTDLVSYERVQARRMPSDHLEAGHFGSGLSSLRAGSMGQMPSHVRRPITHPPAQDAACADAKTQTVCEASAQTEDETPAPIRERVICIPSGARPPSCTPVIVPVKASRQDSRTKRVRKKTVKAKQAEPADTCRISSRQNRPMHTRPVSAPAPRKTAYGKNLDKQAAHKQTTASPKVSAKVRRDLPPPEGWHLGSGTDPPAVASPPHREEGQIHGTLDHSVSPEKRCPALNPAVTQPAGVFQQTEESAAAASAECSQQSCANIHSSTQEGLLQSSQTAVPACCHCSGAVVSAVPGVPVATQEPHPKPQIVREAPKVARLLQNPERQSMVSTLEKAVADLERDVMARAAQPSDASGPSFANSLESLAALEAEITAQQRRLASVGIVSQGGLPPQSMESRPAHRLHGPATTVPGDLRSAHWQPMVTTADSLGRHEACNLEEQWSRTGTLMRGGQDSGAYLPQQQRDSSSHLLRQEPSFSHTASSTLESHKHGVAEPVRERDSSSSPDGNFSTVSIEDRLKRLGLSDQISQLIKDITADTESTSSPAHSPGDTLPWLRMVGSTSDTASTVTLPSLAPPKPLDARREMRSSSASPLDEFASSRSNDAAQISPTLAGRLPFSKHSDGGRTPSPADSSPAMPAADTAVQFRMNRHGASHASSSTSARTDDWGGGAEMSDRLQGDGPFGDTSTARSMDEVLSTVMRGTASCTGSEGGRSASLQLGDDRSQAEKGRGAGAAIHVTGDTTGSAGSPQHSSPVAPFSLRQVESDKSFLSPLASSDASMRADSTTATPVDLRADVDSILCGSFWRS